MSSVGNILFTSQISMTKFDSQSTNTGYKTLENHWKDEWIESYCTLSGVYGMPYNDIYACATVNKDF